MEQQSVEGPGTVQCDVPRMELESVIGFNGKVQNGLKVHPDRQHIIYPLGCAVVIENISTSKQGLLWGHKDYVTCIAISSETRNGELIASGEQTHMGFKAEVIVWHYPTRQMLFSLKLHKNNIQALAFSPNDLYLATLGGFDDSSVVVWDMSNGASICGSPAQVKSAGNSLCICFSKKKDTVFVTGGESTLRVWELDVENRKIRPSEVQMGQLKRSVECIQMDDLDEKRQFFYCGTSTGDILAINMDSCRFQYKAPDKKNFENGVTSLTHLKNCNFLVGTGSGKLYELKFPIPKKDEKQAKPKIVRSWQDESVKSNKEAAITSIATRGSGHQFFIGTANARIYKFSYENSKCDESQFEHCELLKTCHSDIVEDVVFPPMSSEIIITCQREQIRIWSVKNMKELNRYIVPNMTCKALCLACDGQAIVSAWDDGVIRVFGFNKTGIVLKASILSAHNKGVTAVACTKNIAMTGEWDFKIISGGCEGQVRIWQFRNSAHGGPSYSLLNCLKEHKAVVTDIKIGQNDRECISASTDGTCIIWDLIAARRIQTVFANTLFKCACYGPHERQVITSGTDRTVAYWEVSNGSEIRDVEGAKSGSVNAMDISCIDDSDNAIFVTGGEERLVKVWDYMQAEVASLGLGHSAAITRVRISPERKYIVSVSADGAILLWKFPCLRR